MSYQVRCRKIINGFRKGKLYNVSWDSYSNNWYFSGVNWHGRMSDFLFKEHFEFVSE